jgi:hypothetical protein
MALIVVMFVVFAAIGDRFTGLRGHMPWLVPVELMVIVVLGFSQRGSRDSKFKPPEI